MKTQQPDAVPIEFLAMKLHMVGVVYKGYVWTFSAVAVSLADKPVIFDWPKITSATSRHKELNLHYSEVLKRFAAALLVGLDGRYSPVTVKQKVIWLRGLFGQLQAKGCEVLSLVSSANITEQLFAGDVGGGRLKRATLDSRIKVVKQLHKMRGVVGWTFAGDPIDKKNVSNKMRALGSPGYWEAPPEPLCIDLLRASISFLKDHAAAVIHIYSRYVQAVESGLNAGIAGKKPIANYVSKSVSASDYMDLLSRIDKAKTWPCTALSVARLVNFIAAACFIIISFTCGPRVSELRRATSTSVKPRKHVDGVIYYYYHAARSKGHYSSSTHTSTVLTTDANPWILSPAAVDAFKILVELNSFARAKTGLDSLWLTTSGNALWPHSPKKGHFVATGASMNARMNSFASFIIPALSTRWPGRLHSHMGRKHLARFIAKRDRTALGDLAQQYSHLSAESIDISYARPDSEFQRMVRDELAGEMSQVAVDLLGVKPESVFCQASDRAGGRIVGFLGELRSSRDIKLLLASGVQLMPCQWGVCLYRQETSACDGAKTEPNPINRTPEICSSCSNFMATPKHSQWWQEHLMDSIRVSKQADLPMQTKALIAKRIAMADSVLAVIGELEHD